jgi:hypothetical protein
MGEGEVDFDAMLGEVAKNASSIVKQKESAEEDEALRERASQDLVDRRKALQLQRNAFDGLARLGMPDFVMNFDQPNVPDITEVARVTELATEAVELAQAELERLQTHLIEQLQKLISTLNAKFPPDKQLDEIGDRTPEAYVVYLQQHEIASKSMSDQILAYFTERFAAVRSAEHSLRQAEVALERIVGPAEGQGAEPTDQAKQYMHQIAEARDVIVKTEQNPYVMDAIWGKPGEVAVDEDGKAKIIKEGEPGQAEYEKKSRETFVRSATNFVMHKLGLGWVKAGESSDYPLFNYYENTFNKFIDEEVQEVQESAPLYSYGAEDARLMSTGFENYRNPGYSNSHNSERTITERAFLLGERLGQTLGYKTSFPHLTMDRNGVINHLSTFQRFKALAETDSGKLGVFPHAKEWMGIHGHLAGNLRSKGMRVEKGEAIVPDEWMTDPTKKAEIEAANVEYQAELKSAKEAVLEHQERTVSDLQEKLDKIQLTLEYFNRTDAEINLLNSESMPPKEKEDLVKLQRELQQLTKERAEIDARKTGLLARYSKEKQNQDYSRVAGQIIAKEQEIVEQERLGEVARSRRVSEIIAEWRTKGVHIGSRELYLRDIGVLRSQLDRAQSLLIELGS